MTGIDGNDGIDTPIISIVSIVSTTPGRLATGTGSPLALAVTGCGPFWQ